jgi:hypothetical protein
MLSERALQILVDLLVQYLKERLIANDYPYGNPDAYGVGNKVASGSLYNSIRGSVEIGTDGLPYAVIDYNDYLQYVQRGRPAQIKRVPISALLQWISIKGLKGRDKKGRFIPNLSLAFAIQTNIYKYGIRPANIYDRGFDDLEDLFTNFPNNLPLELQAEAEELFEAVADDIVNKFLEQTLEVQIKT